MLRKSLTAKKLNIKFATKTRDELIDLSRALAHLFETRFLTNPKDIPHIAISGGMGGGKSMVIEAIMKELLDEYDAADMKERYARREMFIEQEPCHALSVYCQAIGNTMNQPVMYGFDRITSIHSLEKASKALVSRFNNAAKNNNTPAQGAIFTSSFDQGNTTPWLVINLLNASKNKKDVWHRDIVIEAHNQKLQNSPAFQIIWNIMRSSGEHPNYQNMLTDIASGLAKKPIYMKAPKNESKQTNISDAEILKFIYWNREDIGLDENVLITSLAKLHDHGKQNEISQFIELLKEKGDNDFADKVTDKTSSLSRIFGRLAMREPLQFNTNSLQQSIRNKLSIQKTNAPVAHDLNVEKFIEKLCDTDIERRQNFVNVLTHFCSDKDMTALLNAKLTISSKLSALNLMSRSNQQGLSTIYNNLSNDKFPQARQRIARVLDRESREINYNQSKDRVLQHSKSVA